MTTLERLHNVLRLFYVSYNNLTYRNIRSFSNSSLYSLMLTIDTSKDFFEVPIICTNRFDYNSSNNSLLIKALSIEETNTTSYKTGKAIISNLCKVYGSNDLMKNIINGNTTYYCGSGLLADANKELLMLNTLGFRKTDTSCMVTERIMHINPKVFLDQTDILNKCIIKDVIPYYAAANFLSNPYLNMMLNYSSPKVTIKVDTMSDLYITNTLNIGARNDIPDISNEQLNNLILQNLPR